jgi:chemotaxis protein histidine kinase CheA/ActR/RegA family two-component response regulator
MAETDRILGYFLDEAQEHLRTIEEGLIVPASLDETAKIKEVFRAAHSIKGGAAMLGLEVVHQIGNHFEQAFKAIKDKSIPVDEKLQDLLLEGLEILRLSIQMVQHGQVVPPSLVQEPVFAKIAKRIQRLGGDRSANVDDSDLPLTDPAIEQVFGNYVNQKLQQFTEVCRKTQAESITKQELQPICQKIGSLGESFEYLAWTNLLISCRLAVNNPLNSVVQLREVIPNAIHQAQMLVMAGKHHAITSTPELEILLAPNAINSTRSQTDLGTYDTLDSISNVWDDIIITEEEVSDLPSDRPTSADFLFEPQMVSTDTVTMDSETLDSDSELDEFMQLFDEELSFDGTWVQNEDVLAEEEELLDLPSAAQQPDASANLWDEDISSRPLSNAFMNNEPAIGAQLPQFDFEQMSDSELFVEDVTDTALKPSPVMPTAAVDWSGLLADIPDEVIVDYREPIQPPPDLPPDRALPDKVPVNLSNGLGYDLSNELDDLSFPPLNHNFGQDLNDPFAIDFAELPFGLDLEDSLEELPSAQSVNPFLSSEPVIKDENNGESKAIDELMLEAIDDLDDEPLSPPPVVTTAATSFSPPAHPDLQPIDADYLKELAMFDDLLADTKTTDVDLADLEQMIIDGNLEEELDLENIEDFSPASVNSKVNSKNLINFDDFLTEAKTPVNNTTNSNQSKDYQDSHSNLQTTAENPNSASPLAAASAATFATERAATEMDLGLEELDLLDMVSLEDLNDLDRDLDDVLAGLNMLDISDAEEPSGSLADLLDENFDKSDFFDKSMNESESISELFMDEFDINGNPLLNRITSLSEQDTKQQDDLMSLDLLDANLSDLLDLDNDPQAFNSMGGNVEGDFDVNPQFINSDDDWLTFSSLDKSENTDSLISEPISGLSTTPITNQELDLLAGELPALDSLDLELPVASTTDQPSDLSDLADLSDLELGELNNDLDGLDDLDDFLGENSAIADLTLADLSLDDLEINAAPVESSLTDLDDFLAAEETFGDLDALLTVPPSEIALPAVAIAAAVTAAAVVTPIPSAAPVAKTPSTKSGRGKQRTFEQTMKVSVKNLNNLNNLTGELVVNRNTLEQDQNRMRQFIDKLLLEVQKLNEVGKSMQDLYEKSLLESSLLASRQQNQQAKSMVPGNNSGGDSEYDPLEMDKFTPVHLISQQMIELTVRIRESTSDIEFVVDSSTEVTRSLRQITSQLQEDLNKSRMLPFSHTSDRLQRGVRDNGLKYGKEVDLRVEGSDTLIDKVILESLNDPLIHMVNNAIAHGIESPADRQAAGKPADGVITINATHQGTQTVISVKDDGAGIDTERVKNKAIEKGIISPAKAVTMTKQEVYELLFLPSFSTKDQADELAGRGVGMDVVLSSLQEIRGTITTESKLGKGTTFTIRLPLALSITKALMASNKDVGIAFPMDGIEDSLDIKPYSISENEAGQKCFPWRDQQMPYRPLSDLLAFNRPMKRVNYYGAGHEEAEQTVSIIVLRSGSDLVAVEVDRVLGEQEIVIKPLQGPAPKPLGIAGATVLGDGRIIPIADVLELVDIASGKLEKHVNQTWSMGDIPEDQSAQREPMVLVVDDSITVRQLLSLTFTKAGYRVEQARDGQEAWDKLRAGLPCDIIFCDIEMPRMDGLELLSKVQGDDVLRKIPMAMLTSRGSDRHRQIASQLGASGYFIKPYLEDALLEAVKRMIKGEVLAIV